MHRTLEWVLACLFGGAIAAIAYVALVADPLFVASLALFWALGIGLSMEYLFPYTGGGEDWEVARWSGASGGLMAVAATLGVSPTLPIPADLRLAFGLFVLGTMLTAVNVGLALGVAMAGRPPAEPPGL